MVYCILNSVKLPQADFFLRQLVQILEIGANDMQENVGMEAARKAAETARREFRSVYTVARITDSGWIVR